MRSVCAWAWALSLLPSSVLADHVVLLDGAVLEGKATRQGDKVLVEMSSGQITLDAAVVVRIEDTESDLERFEEKLRALKPRDLKGALALANFCRDHDLRAQELVMLKKVIEIEPEHAEARARLGYVKTSRGYVTFAEAQREKGLVLREGQWVTKEQALELEKLAAEARKAELARDREALAVERERVQLARERETAERERDAEMPSHRDAPDVPFWFAPSVPGCAPYGCTSLTPPRREPARFINGARDPRDQSFSLPGTRDPRSYF